MNGCRFELGQVSGHAIAVQLKCADSLAPGQHFKSFFVVNWNIFYVYIQIFYFFDSFHGIGQYGQIANAQKIKFQKTGFFYGMHIKLGDDLALFALGLTFPFGIVLQGSEFYQWSRSNHYSGGMNRDVTSATFYFFCHIYDLFGLIVILVHSLELRYFSHCSVYSHGKTLGSKRNQFGYSVSDFVGEIHGSGHISDGSSGHHGSKGAYLGHFVLAIFIPDIGDHFVATVVGVVHIYIWSGRSFRV